MLMELRALEFKGLVQKTADTDGVDKQALTVSVCTAENKTHPKEKARKYTFIHFKDETIPILLLSSINSY